MVKRRHAKRRAELNLRPEKMEQQKMTRKERELASVIGQKKQQQAGRNMGYTASRESAEDRSKKKGKNMAASSRFIAEAHQLGYHHKPWEDDSMLLKRISRDTHASVEEEMVRARFAKAGRDLGELKADYRELDEHERRRKLAQMLQREKEKKRRKKDLAFRKRFGGGESEGGSDMDEEEELKGKEETGGDVEKRKLGGGNVEDGPGRMSERRNKEEKKEDGHDKKKKKVHLSRKKRLEAKRKERNRDAKKSAILYAKEYIPFGERVDAPPEHLPVPKFVKKMVEVEGEGEEGGAISHSVTLQHHGQWKRTKTDGLLLRKLLPN